MREHSNEKLPALHTFVSRKHHADLTAESFAELLHICPKYSNATMVSTTQNLLSCRYRSDQMYNLKTPKGRFSTNTLFADMKSLHAKTFCQVYYHKVGFAECNPKLNAKVKSSGETLDNFVHDFGAPEDLTFYHFQSQVGKNTKFLKNIHKYNIDHRVFAP